MSQMSQDDKRCRECEDAAGAVEAWKRPVLAKTVLSGSWWLLCAWGVAGVFSMAARDATPAGFYFNALGVLLILALLLAVGHTLASIVRFLVVFLPRNVFAKNRGIYLFADKQGWLHAHLTVPIATAYAATPAIIGIGVGRWLRKTVTRGLGAPWQNWKVVGEPTLDKLVVEDQHGCKLPGDANPARVLAHIAKYEGVSAIIHEAMSGEIRSGVALVRLGEAVHVVIILARASKGVTLSPQVKALRERLERALQALVDSGFTTDANVASWRESAAQQLGEEHRAAVAEAYAAAGPEVPGVR